MRFSFLFIAVVLCLTAYAEAAYKNNQAASYLALQPSFQTKTLQTSASYTRGPYSMCYNSKTGKIFVVSIDDNRVLRYSDWASFLCQANAEMVIGQPNFTASAPNTFRGPTGCAINDNDILWVSDPGHNRVLGWDQASTVSWNAFPSRLIGQESFFSYFPNVNESATPTERTLSDPFAVAISSKDNGDTLYIADGRNQRVLIFDEVTAMQQEFPFATRVIGQDGFYVYIIPGTKPSNPPTFFNLGYPIGIAYHDKTDSLYVADQVVEGRSWLRRYDSASTLNGAVGTSALFGATDYSDQSATPLFAEQGRMQYPRGLTVHQDGTLFVGDVEGVVVKDAQVVGNHRVLVFYNAHTLGGNNTLPLADAVLGQPDFTSNRPNQGLTNPTDRTLNNPRFMVTVNYLKRDILFVCDRRNNRIVGYGTSEEKNEHKNFCCRKPSGLVKLVWYKDEDACDDKD